MVRQGGAVAETHALVDIESKWPFWRWRRIGNLREILVDRLHCLEQGNKSALANRLDDQPIAIAMHNRFIPGQFEFHGDTHGLISTVPE